MQLCEEGELKERAGLPCVFGQIYGGAICNALGFWSKWLQMHPLPIDEQTKS